MHYGIIAAGEGSRLVQEGVQWPKPLVRLQGVPMVQRLMQIMTDCRAESISIIVNEQMHQVQEFVRRLAAESPVPVRLVVKSTPSSMHSFWELSRVMGREGKFILTTVDTIFREEDFARYEKAFEASDADALMAVTDYIDDEKPLYVATDPDLKVTAFLDRPAEGVRYISGGIYGLTPKAFTVLEHCIESGVSRMRNFQRALVSEGLDVRAFPLGKILDVDHAGDIEKAEAFLAGETKYKD